MLAIPTTLVRRQWFLNLPQQPRPGLTEDSRTIDPGCKCPQKGVREQYVPPDIAIIPARKATLSPLLPVDYLTPTILSGFIPSQWFLNLVFLEDSRILSNWFDRKF